MEVRWYRREEAAAAVQAKEAVENGVAQPVHGVAIEVVSASPVDAHAVLLGAGRPAVERPFDPEVLERVLGVFVDVVEPVGPDRLHVGLHQEGVIVMISKLVHLYMIAKEEEEDGR